MNVYLILAAVIAWGASVGGSAMWGIHTGKALQVAEQAAVTDAVVNTRQAAAEGAADAIAKIKITNTTIQGRVEREIRTNTVYADCKLPVDGLRLANQAITNTRPVQPAGDGKLPATDATTGRR